MLRETIDVLSDKKKSQPSYTYEIIIVDDGSKDNTTEVALDYSKETSTENCRVLTLGKSDFFLSHGIPQQNKLSRTLPITRLINIYFS